MPVSRAMRIKNISLRAQSYGMPGETVDGNDVVKVHQTVQPAIERARNGEGPSLIECKTYRLRAHCERYQETRSKEELDFWWERCPIRTFRRTLLGKKVLDEQRAQKIEEEVREEIDQAVKFAEESPFPKPEEIFEDVYAQGTIQGGVLCMK